MRAEAIKAEASQRLYFRATEGRPTSTPTVGIKNEGGGVVSAAAATNVTQSAVTTTVATSGAVGARSLTLTDGTGVVVGDSYLLTSTKGEREWVRVISYLANVATFDEPLEYAHLSGSTFVSCDFYYTLQTSDVASLAERMQATASYVVGGLTHMQRILFDVVLHALPNPLTAAVLKASSPDLGLAEWAEQRGSDYDRQRTAAWEAVCLALRQNGRRPALVVDVEDLKAWALAELALQLQRAGVRVRRDLDPVDAIADLKDARTRERDAALGALSWYDETEDGSVGDDEEIHPMRLDFVR